MAQSNNFAKAMRQSGRLGDDENTLSTAERYAQSFDNLMNRGNRKLAQMLGVIPPDPTQAIPERSIGLNTPTATPTPTVGKSRKESPTPQVTPSPSPTSYPTPNPLLETDTHGWSISNRPKVNFIGGSDAAELGRSYYRNYKHIGEFDAFMRKMGLGGLSWRELGGLIGEATAAGVNQQLYAGMRGIPMFTIQGDPFHHNIKELNLPKNVPLGADRLYWKERGL